MLRTRALTLIELLVVMAIVAVIAAMLLTAIGRAKASAQAVACRNNLKQLGVATLLFTAENDDRLPKDGTPNGTSINEGWYIDLPRILQLPTYHEMPWRTNAGIDPGHCIWICPSNPRRSDGFMLFHYCLNEHINGSGSGNQAKLGSIDRPVQTIWLFDNGKTNGVAQQNNVHNNLHNRGAQFVFLDAHVARFRNTEYWDFTNKKGITNNPALIWMP